MSGEYSVPCQRCGKRNALGRKLDPVIACVFAFSSGRQPQDARLCGSCSRTVDNLRFAIAKAKTRSAR